ncbi:hypothetical protein KSS87_000431 [Heliosperma pusillum]|nr:hypothetical protein KSS87_000431 [Heliosperma pusillum]
MKKFFGLFILMLIFIQAFSEVLSAGNAASSVTKMHGEIDDAALYYKRYHPRKIRDAAKHQGKKCAAGHATVAAQDATVFLLALMVITLPALATPASVPMAIALNALKSPVRRERLLCLFPAL